MKDSWENHKIALALSGGGIRAMIFHLGVLRYLSEHRALESVDRISTVSGGSLLLGLIFKECSYRWPSSNELLAKAYPVLREKLCTKSIQFGVIKQLFNPKNWSYLLSRANILAKTLHDEWGITAALSDLAKGPEWSINGTTAETGKRFRFKTDSLGDYMLGYAPPGDFPLADALAVSAAFPGGFGPLSLATKNFVWQKRPKWDSPLDCIQVTQSDYKRLHLYDGGVYDNLGLEPFFDAGRGAPKPYVDFIIVSDAGSPLVPFFSSFSLNPWRLKRVSDIMSDQSRALRVRTFMNYLGQDVTRGAYVYIGTQAAKKHYCPDGSQPANFPTTLRRVTKSEFDSIAGHGFAVAGALL